MNKEGSQYKIYKYNQKLKCTNYLNKKRVYHDKLNYYNKFNQYGGDDISLEKCKVLLDKLIELEPRLSSHLKNLEKVFGRYHTTKKKGWKDATDRGIYSIKLIDLELKTLLDKFRNSDKGGEVT